MEEAGREVEGGGRGRGGEGWEEGEGKVIRGTEMVDDGWRWGLGYGEVARVLRRRRRK